MAENQTDTWHREGHEIFTVTPTGWSRHLVVTIEGGPTIFGALNGVVLAEGIDPAPLCPGCAFRQGTAANQIPSTTCDADFCSHPDEQPFMCHAGLDERGEPTRGCPGFAQLRARRKHTEIEGMDR